MKQGKEFKDFEILRVHPAYVKSQDFYGFQAELLKVCEELGECTSAIVSYFLGEDDFEHVVEEMADVENLFEQIKQWITPARQLVVDIRIAKLNRLEKRINDAIAAGRNGDGFAASRKVADELSAEISKIRKRRNEGEAAAGGPA